MSVRVKRALHPLNLLPNYQAPINVALTIRKVVSTHLDRSHVGSGWGRSLRAGSVFTGHLTCFFLERSGDSDGMNSPRRTRVWVRGDCQVYRDLPNPTVVVSATSSHGKSPSEVPADHWI